MVGVSVAFTARADALTPQGVVGWGSVARALALRVLRDDDTTLGRLRGVTADDGLLLLGDSLPWVDGVSYLGCDPHAPLLLLPTHLCPNVPVDAFERAVRRRAEGLRPPIAVFCDPPRLLSVAEARPLHRARLQVWITARS
jgi:hypothetical protein